MAARNLKEFYEEYRKGFNPITGEKNLFKDITDQMIWDAAVKSVTENIKESDGLLDYYLNK